jgi:hypothetical protein
MIFSVDKVPCCDDADGHIIKSVLGDGSVQNGDCEVGSPERGTAVEADVTRHGHIQASEGTRYTRVLTRPVRNDEALESEFRFEDLVQEVRVLALKLISNASSHKFTPCTYDVAVIGLVVRAHDTAGTSTDSISKGPDVKLVQSDIVDIGRNSIRDVRTSLSEMLLLVEDVMLGASNDTSILDTHDGLCVEDTRENGVGTKAFPVATTFGTATKRANDRAEHDIDTLVAVLAAHVVTTGVGEGSVPCCGNSDTGGEGGYEVACSLVSSQ